jgi:hypothetical protein
LAPYLEALQPAAPGPNRQITCFSGLTWPNKKTDRAFGNERFFVGQWSAKALLSQQMQKQSFCTPYCNLMLASSE